MKIQVRYFGMISDARNCNAEVIEFPKGGHVNLRDFFETRYPDLKSMSYTIAVDQTIQETLDTVQHTNEIALLPPFAGG